MINVTRKVICNKDFFHIAYKGHSLPDIPHFELKTNVTASSFCLVVLWGMVAACKLHNQYEQDNKHDYMYIKSRPGSWIIASVKSSSSLGTYR